MIYLDNSATSFPKPKVVTDAVIDFIKNIGVNINRGAYTSSYKAENIVYETRELTAEFFGYENADNVVFTKNVTESLNAILFGLLKEGDHVVVSSVEHNAVMRPLNALSKKGVTFSRALCNKYGELDIEDFKSKIKKNTKAVIMTHASNVCGTVLNLSTVGNICKEKGIFFIVDSAQTAGSIDVNMKRLNANAIAFTAHKGLLAPQGLGGFIVDEEINKHIIPFIYGGTGSISQMEEQPEFMPDKFEAGTLNLPAIFGLNAGIKYIKEKGISNIHNYEMELTEQLIDGLKEINGIKLIGRADIQTRTPCVSIDIENKDLGLISHDISKTAGIMVRCGLHCAPNAHKTFSTYPQGTIRMSIGQFNTKDEIDSCIEYFYKLQKKN